MRSTPTFEAHRAERDEDGHALVVGNGTARPRQVTTGAGAIEVKDIVSATFSAA